MGPDPIVIAVQPVYTSSAPTIDCADGMPSAPASTLALDAKEDPLDADPDPRVDQADCTTDIDSTEDATPPDVLLTTSLQAADGPNPGAEFGPLTVADLQLTQLDADDVTFGGGIAGQFGAIPTGAVEALLVDTLTRWLDSAPLCGAPAPY